jgi:hypothetical protein
MYTEKQAPGTCADRRNLIAPIKSLNTAIANSQVTGHVSHATSSITINELLVCYPAMLSPCARDVACDKFNIHKLLGLKWEVVFRDSVKNEFTGRR